MGVLSETANNTPAAPEKSIDQEIAELNASVDAEDEPAAVEVEETADAEAEDSSAQDDADAGENEEETGEPEEGEGDAAGEKPAETPAIKFEDTDDPETYAKKKEALLEQYELPEEIASLVEVNEKRLAAAQAVVAEFENVANKDTILEMARAANAIYETEVDPTTGDVKVNAKPLVEFLDKQFGNEKAQIAEALFSSDSAKYKGASLFQELIVDVYGKEKGLAIINFATNDAPLPTVPEQAKAPAVVKDETREAYWRLPEVKRFEIESLAEQIDTLATELKDDPDSYYAAETREKLRTAQAKLAAELESLADKQTVINSTREAEQRSIRQQQQETAKLQARIATEYNSSVYGLADAFAKDLAPNLSFADTDTQLSHARNIQTRLFNALGFIINGDGSFGDEPMADYYAKQLKEEGVSYDFAKGRELLQRHYKATERVVALKERGASKQQIEVAEKALNHVMFDLKKEQKELLGQLSKKYVKSASAALEKQIDAAKGKKVVGRKLQAGTRGAEGNRSGKDSLRRVDSEIAAYNRSIKDGDDLFNEYAV